MLIFGASQPNDPDPATLTDLQIQLDTFRQIYNTERIHRALPPHTIPAQAYAALPKAAPPDHTTESHFRIRHDTVDNCGKLTLRYATRLHQLGIGIAHAGTKVLIIVTTANVTVLTTPRLPTHRQPHHRPQPQLLAQPKKPRPMAGAICNR